MRRQMLLNMFNNGVNITKGNAFFRGEFKLPANALFGEKVDQRRCRYSAAAW